MYNDFGKMSRSACSIIYLCLLLFVTGCGGSSVRLGGSTVRYINPDANFSYIKTVAVLPFNNLTNDGFAGERVRSTLMVDLISRGVFDVLEQGEVSKVLSLVLRSSGVPEGSVVNLDKETLKLLGDKLGVEAVIVGSVDDYSGRGGGTTVSLSIRMLDTSSGVILWQAQSVAKGASVWRNILGLSVPDRTTLTRRAVKKALDTLI